MPKMRTNRAAAKRFKATGTGKVKRSRAFGSHLLSKKTSRRKRQLRKSDFVSSSDMQKIKKLVNI
jgi:large subunit ribosomal protein L35